MDSYSVANGGLGPQASHPLAWLQGVQHGER